VIVYSAERGHPRQRLADASAEQHEFRALRETDDTADPWDRTATGRVRPSPSLEALDGDVTLFGK